MSILQQINLKYKGRKAQRKDSKARREAILSAALRVIVRDGLRELRHRAVAKEADVPLSATTYYFADIESLIHDAYLFHVESTLSQVSKLEEHAFKALKAFQLQQDHQQLKASLHQMLMLHIKEQTANADDRMVEWTFRQQAMRDEALAKALAQPKKVLLHAISQFYLALNPDNTDAQAQAKAHMVLGSLLHLEYELLLPPSPAMNLTIADRVIASLVEDSLV